MKETFTLVATAAAGLEAVVGRELRELGYDTQVENGKVRFQGGVRAIAETNLWLRAADRIKIVVGEFPARTFEELFQGVLALDWENYLPLGEYGPTAREAKPGQSASYAAGGETYAAVFQSASQARQADHTSLLPWSSW